MDPFQQPSRTPHAFRVVPMTHLTKPANSGWAASLRESGASSAPVASAADPLHRSPFMLNRVELHSATEADGGTGSADNVRKWQHFGLRVTQTDISSSSSLARLATTPQLANQPASKETEQCSGTNPPPPTLHSHRTEETLEEAVNVSAPEGHNGVHNSVPFHRLQAVGQRAKELAVVEIVVDDDGDADCRTPPSAQAHRLTGIARHTLSSLQDRSPSSPTPAAPVLPSTSTTTTTTTAAADRTETASAEAVRRLQCGLTELSEKVQHSTEEQRCGPPKRDGGGGGGPPSWAAKRWGGKKTTKRTAGPRNDNDDGDGGGDGPAAAAVASERDPATGTSAGKKGKTTRKRGRAGDDATAPAKKGGKRKRANGAADDDGDMGNAKSTANGPHTLFSFSTSSGTTVDARNLLAGLQGTATAAATVSVPLFYLQTSTEDLFSDIRRTLNDPDRIQAPPLFVGISTLASDSGGGGVPLVECRTNFTYHSSAAKTVKGRASSCFSSVDPVYTHQHVELVMARWKDAVYALPAQTLGFPFLHRVLTELPGVELITFNAQAVLVALLAYFKGTRWSHCISDVRVMAWMAQLHIGGASAQSSRAAFPAAVGGAAAGDGTGGSDADMNVLYDYDQLLLRVSAGKPPPSVVLEKASDGDYSSANSALYATGSCTAAPSSAEATAPPLTPAQRLLAQQVYYLATVYRSLYGLLGSKGLLQAFLRQEKRIALLLALMHFNGIGVDLPEVHRYQKSCEAEMARQRSLASTLVPELGDDFNIQSHDQCRRALYEVLKLGKFLTAKTPGGEDAVAGTGLTITKGGRLSTAEDTLRALAPHHEFPACLLRYRKASKLMQTYVEGMMSYAVVRAEKADADTVAAAAASSKAGSPVRSTSREPSSPQLLGESADVHDASNPFVDRLLRGERRGHSRSTASAAGTPHARGGGVVDEEASVTAVGDLTLPGRGYATIHPNFLQEGTDTGRLSCVEPNLQNLPRNGATSLLPTAADGDDGEEDLLGFRRCFVAPPGFLLLSVDYQQIELRVLAHLCGDKALIDALAKSTDIHRTIAEVVFKTKPVSTEQRTLAKRVVFGVLYGAGPKTLAAHMGVTVERALHISALLTHAFPGIETYHRRVVEECRVSGFVRTISGRLRYLPDIQSTVMSRRSYAERQAFNSVVQGSAADVMKMAMLAVATDVLQRYNRADVCLLSQIHDEMVFMVRKELLAAVVPLVSSAMSHAMHLLVPLSVTVKFGHSLGDLQEWSVEHDLGLGVDG